MNIHTIINNIFQSKTYILSIPNIKEAWLIDCGDFQPIIEYITKNKLNLKGILITHTHFDHIYGLNEIINYFPETQVYTSKEGEIGLYNEYLNLSKYNEQPWIYKYNNVNTITEQSELYVLDQCVKAYFTPGHDVSCLSFKIGNFLFTGDSYIPEYKTFACWPLSNKQKAKLSEENILKMIKDENLHIQAGH